MPEPTPASLRIAVLMDSDNVSPKFAPLILEELATYGTPTIKRAYGDWTTTNLNGWKKALNHHAIQPVQQFAYTVGKNSSDSALIIDAMDLLWMGNVDAFALVSSDSDFTRLATRLREGGKRVIGLGARKTPASLRNAVDQFIYLELLGTATDQDIDDDETGEDAPAKEENAKASEGSGRSGSRRGGRGRGRGSKTADTPEAPDADVADAEAPAADEAPAGNEAPAGDATAGKDGKGPQAKSGGGRRGRRASSSDVTEDPTPPEVPVEAEPEHDEADAAPRIDLQAALTKAVNATSTDDGWATLSLIGQHLSRTHVDFDPRDFGHSKLSTLVEDQPYLRTRTEGRTMEVSLVRRRSRRAEG
ncbi:NYN domain-containing protein [Micrococcus luteus]|uniref:NYN domain-containing protein n=1 Tax=Micrococcus luteus TaxID=1270 RepID=UPI0019D2ACC1|nr:NYN domain-containing protein [Micrococcus luteus]MBN6751275.1 NYN domain-containing protein [Micrococcus luteus]MBN6760809.1 NYN domain-containing protein [Micrococcus luteus]MBN6801665.1 NYN domain-containing protein [Micrococcus luteus]MDT1990454.1 NYN domain-containing protein [Micrococcus luteus]